MRRTINFLAGAIMGGLVGSVLALLFAPESGDELRKGIQSKITRIQQEVKDAASERRLELENQLETLREPKK